MTKNSLARHLGNTLNITNELKAKIDALEDNGAIGFIKKKLDILVTFMFFDANETCYGKDYVNITSKKTFSNDFRSCDFRRGRISDSLCSCEKELETSKKHEVFLNKYVACSFVFAYLPESIRENYVENNLTMINKYFANENMDENDTCDNIADWCWMEMWSNQLNLASYITRLTYKMEIDPDECTNLDKSLLYDNMIYFEALYKSIYNIQSYNTNKGKIINMTFVGKNDVEMRRIINETFDELKMLGQNTSINLLNFKAMFEQAMSEETRYIEHVSQTRIDLENAKLKKGLKYIFQTASLSKFLDDLIRHFHTLEDAETEVLAQNKYVSELQDALKYLKEGKDEYLKYIQTIKAQFDNASAILMETDNEPMEMDDGQTLFDTVSGNFENFKSEFMTYKSSYRKYMTSMITNLDGKIHSLKTSALNQRIMILDVFYKYCDALFYQTFKKCHQISIDMSGNFTSILKELSTLKWKIATFKSMLPQNPYKFESHLATIENDDVYPQPIQKLKANK